MKLLLETKDFQIENGNYTRIINPLIDELIKIPFKGCELSVVLFIIRKTYGYHKTQDAISISQFERALKRSRPTIVKALKNLQLVNIVLLVKTDNSPKQGNVWKLNKYFTEWQLVNTCLLVKRNAITSKHVLTHKRYITKDNIPEQSSESVKNKKTMKKNSFRYNENNPSDTFDSVIDLDSGEEVKNKISNATKKYWDLIEWSVDRRGFKFINIPKQFKAFKKAKDADITPTEIKNRWQEFEVDEFRKSKGFDWLDVVNSFDKKR